MTVFIFYIFIFLLLIPAGISASTTVTGYRGSSVEIRCSYDSGYETYMKYLCRGACSWETKDIPVESGSTAKDQRFSLKDDTAARVFTVTITDLRSEDAGQYWCGIKRSLPRDVYTEILLLVRSGSEERGVLHSTPSLPVTTYMPSILRDLNNPPNISAALLFVVVSLLVSGIGLGVLVFFCKRRKNRDAVITDRSQAEVGGVKDDVDCENDPPRNQTSMPMTPVYQSLNPQTNQSDSVYQTLNPSINQSDSVYQSLNPNTNQSDSVYQSLNPNSNQSDSVYQTLNPSINQSDSVYQSLNPNANQSDSVYHTLNPNAK